MTLALGKDARSGKIKKVQRRKNLAQLIPVSGWSCLQCLSSEFVAFVTVTVATVTYKSRGR